MRLYADGSFRAGKQTHAVGTVTDEHGRDVVEKYRHLFADMDLVMVPHKLTTQPPRLCAQVRDESVQQQNNGGELFAMLMALRIARFEHQRQPNVVQIISGDNACVVDWWSRGHVNPKTAKTMSREKLAAAKEAGNIRRELGKWLIVHKIAGKDNPADLGYH